MYFDTWSWSFRLFLNHMKWVLESKHWSLWLSCKQFKLPSHPLASINTVWVCDFHQMWKHMSAQWVHTNRGLKDLPPTTLPLLSKQNSQKRFPLIVLCLFWIVSYISYTKQTKTLLNLKKSEIKSSSWKLV